MKIKYIDYLRRSKYTKLDVRDEPGWNITKPINNFVHREAETLTEQYKVYNAGGE